MFGLGAPEIIIILVVALLVFGPKKLPELGKSLGQSLREFKRGTGSMQAELKRSLDFDDVPAPQPVPVVVPVEGEARISSKSA